MKISPAVYPHPGVNIGGVYREKCVGLELRDYFAAKAMQGFLTQDDIIFSGKSMAECAYEMADAMLEARER